MPLSNGHAFFNSGLAISFGIDLLMITLLAFVLYYRRHGRRDLLLGFVAINVGIFTAAAHLKDSASGMAVGFGLFAVLSIIRLRSDSLRQEEVGYYFIALVLGLLNALGAGQLLTTIALNVALLLVVYAVDHPRLLANTRHVRLTLDVVHQTSEALVADLERRLGGTIVQQRVEEVDYVRETSIVDVRYRLASGSPARRPLMALAETLAK